MKELPIIIKADVQGSAEVLADTLTEADRREGQDPHHPLRRRRDQRVGRAAGLGVERHHHRLQRPARPQRRGRSPTARSVDIRLHSVIYNVTDEMKKAMTGLLDPTFKEVRIGVAEVRDIFKMPKFGTIAGCMVTDGRITRVGRHPGAAAARQRRRLRRQDRLAAPLQGRRVSEVKTGFECGIGFDKFNDIKVGDVIEVFVVETRRYACLSNVSRDEGEVARSHLLPVAFTQYAQGSTRPSRVGDQIREELADLLAREVHDPGIGFLTITRVQGHRRTCSSRASTTPRSATTRRGARPARRSSARRRSCGGRSAAAAAEAGARAASSSSTNRSSAAIASSRSSTKSAPNGSRAPPAIRPCRARTRAQTNLQLMSNPVSHVCRPAPMRWSARSATRSWRGSAS